MEEQIFISHPFTDIGKVNDIIHDLFADSEIKPFIAAVEVYRRGQKPNWLWIKEEIDRSKALFLFITPNILQQEHTQNWIAYETGIASSSNPPKPVWVFQVAPIQFSIPYLTHYILMPEVTEEKTIDPKNLGSVFMTLRQLTPEMQKKLTESVTASVMVGLRAFTHKLNLRMGLPKLQISDAVDIHCANCRLDFKFLDMAEIHKNFACPSCAKDISVPKGGGESLRRIARL